MKGNFIKILLLMSLVTFFVIRPFVVSTNYGFPGLISSRNISLKNSIPAFNKKNDFASYHVSHVSACDDTNFRKVVLNTVYKLITSFWREIILTLAVFILSAFSFRLKGRRTLLEIISPQQHFATLCLLRI